MVFGEGHGGALPEEERFVLKEPVHFTYAMKVYHWKSILSRSVGAPKRNSEGTGISKKGGSCTLGTSRDKDNPLNSGRKPWFIDKNSPIR